MKHQWDESNSDRALKSIPACQGTPSSVSQVPHTEENNHSHWIHTHGKVRVSNCLASLPEKSHTDPGRTFQTERNQNSRTRWQCLSLHHGSALHIRDQEQKVRPGMIKSSNDWLHFYTWNKSLWRSYGGEWPELRQGLAIYFLPECKAGNQWVEQNNKDLQSKIGWGLERMLAGWQERSRGV